MLFTLKDRRRPAVAATRLTVADRYQDRAVMVQPLSAYREAMREPRLAAADAAEPAARGRQPAKTD